MAGTSGGTVYQGEARLGGTTWLSSHLIFTNSTGSSDDWILENNHSGKLRILNGWAGGAHAVAFSADGVTFSKRVAIGNVSCDNGLTCGGGLGTTSAVLAVGGNIAARGKIYVINASTGAPWPDYVFRPGYYLRPLAEVACYVQRYQHLPDVPSAAQVLANGLELAEMNAVLLRKVEELTLYLVQLQAANQALAE